MARRSKSGEKFISEEDVLEAFHYLSRDVVAHPLVLKPEPMNFNVTITVDGDIDFNWDTPETAPWVELATYVRKLAMLDDESTNLSKVLILLGKNHQDIRMEVKTLQSAVAKWRGSNKTQLLAENEDGSLSISSNAEAANIVINGSMFHANADLLRTWRSLDPFARNYCLASARDWILTAALLVRDTALLIERVVPVPVPKAAPA